MMIICGFTIDFVLTIVSQPLMLLYLVGGYSNRFFANEQATSEIFLNYGAIPKFVLAGDPRKRSMFIHGGIVHIIGNMIFYIYTWRTKFAWIVLLRI